MPSRHCPTDRSQRRQLIQPNRGSKRLYQEALSGRANTLKRRRVATLDGGNAVYQVLDEGDPPAEWDDYFALGFLPNVIEHLLLFLRKENRHEDKPKKKSIRKILQLLRQGHLYRGIQVEVDLEDPEYVACMTRFYKTHRVNEGWGMYIAQALDSAFKDLTFDIGDMSYYQDERSKPTSCGKVKLSLKYARNCIFELDKEASVEAKLKVERPQESEKIVNCPSTIYWDRKYGFPVSASLEYKRSGEKRTVSFKPVMCKDYKPDDGKEVRYEVHFRGFCQPDREQVLPDLGRDGLWREQVNSEVGSFFEFSVSLFWPPPGSKQVEAISKAEEDYVTGTMWSQRHDRNYLYKGPVFHLYYETFPFNA